MAKKFPIDRRKQRLVNGSPECSAMRSEMAKRRWANKHK